MMQTPQRWIASVWQRFSIPALATWFLSAMVAVTWFAPDSSGEALAWQAAPTALVEAVSHVPAAVFNDVGLQPNVTPPVVVSGQAALRFGTKPGVTYLGAEPCPLCAAERWSFTVATSRFGRWSYLGIDQSASNDVDPNTRTFTFSRATYSSPYVSIRTVELSKLNGRSAVLRTLTATEMKAYTSLDVAKYFPDSPGTLPFLDFANRVVIAGASYDPGQLQALTRAQIAADLSNPSSPVTKSIVATANYMTAAICSIDGEKPSSVCSSAGVTQSANFAKITRGTGHGCTTQITSKPTCAPWSS
jgi:Domain of unknown function (DUF929)